MKPYSRENSAHRRQDVLAALPATAYQIMAKTGLPKSTVYYFLYTSPARRQTPESQVWERTE